MGTVTRSVTNDSLAGKTSPLGNDPPSLKRGRAQDWFEIQTRAGDKYLIHVSSETNFQVLGNLDGLDRDRVPTPELVGEQNDPGVEKFDAGKLTHRLYKYIAERSLIVVRGVYQEHGTAKRYDARTVYLLDSKSGNYLFETDHWWLTQIERLADGWLDVMFGDRRDYGEADFAALYRTRLNILGLPTDDMTQEMATLSRLIYGLSSAYLLTGDERYRKAAAAGVRYQRESFRCLDGQSGERCVWASAKRKSEADKVAKILFPSQFADDKDQIPLYEQIYALAGLAQYYRICNDPDVFTDILRTVRAFQYYWKDHELGGYFSHIDYATFTADSPFLGRDSWRNNRLKKNWNSVGDHIPAYLVNLLLAIDPIPAGRRNDTGMKELRDTCRGILDETTQLIREKFPGDRADIPDKERSALVNERFDRQWVPDHTWGWQQNRGIVGHNLKIAWNLTRAAHYYLGTDKKSPTDGKKTYAAWLMELTEKLGRDMAVSGLDQHRGGCFDAVERMPQNGMPYEITWLPTKDFWQQEQAILAYLILFGYTGETKYLDLARESEAFWNLFFLDRDRWGIFFRVREDGSPVIEGVYGDKGSHSVAGYHSFELNYLAHIYIRAFLPQYHRDSADPEPGRFCLYFRPSPDLVLEDGATTFNVLPDFFPPDLLTLESVQVGGVPRELSPEERKGFYVSLTNVDLGRELAAVFRSKAYAPLVVRGGFEAAPTFESVPTEKQSPSQQRLSRGERPRVDVPVPDWQRRRRPRTTAP